MNSVSGSHLKWCIYTNGLRAACGAAVLIKKKTTANPILIYSIPWDKNTKKCNNTTIKSQFIVAGNICRRVFKLLLWRKQ